MTRQPLGLRMDGFKRKVASNKDGFNVAYINYFQ